MRYSTRFSQKALFCLDEYGPIENAPTLKDACVHLFMAGFIDRCVFTASFIGRCMQAPSKSLKHGAAVNRRRRLQSAAPERSDGAVRFEFDFKIVKDVSRGPRPRYMSEESPTTFFAFRAQLRPKTAQDGLKIGR